MKSNFLRGMYHGIPIALGYLSVSFGFGIMAAKAGLSVLAASAISATNLTSAGQAAGVDIIAASGTIIEMILVQLTINIRYSLMALSLSQKLDRKFTAPHRLAASYGITDEIFAVCSAQKQPLTPAYMYGMILVAFVLAGWRGTGSWRRGGTASSCGSKQRYGYRPLWNVSRNHHSSLKKAEKVYSWSLLRLRR